MEAEVVEVVEDRLEEEFGSSEAVPLEVVVVDAVVAASLLVGFHQALAAEWGVLL